MIPFVPNNTIKPVLCEIDGISIGIIRKIVNTLFPLILVLCIQKAKINPSVTEITVAIIETLSELISAGTNDAEEKTEVMSSDSMLSSIRKNG